MQLFLGGLAVALLALMSFPPDSYRFDLAQDYLSARALRDGIDIFTPIPDLSEHYFGIRTNSLQHANPHPPALVLLFVPVSLLPYEVVFPLWVLANVLIVLWIGRHHGIRPSGRLALLAWPPVWIVLLLGQLEIAILALLLLSWAAADGKQELRAGLWLGLAAALKFYPAVLIVPYLVQRRFRPAASAVAVLAVVQLVNLLVGDLRYFREVLPYVASEHIRGAMNVSVYGAALRLFGGGDMGPLFDAPGLVPLAGALGMAFGLLFLVRLPYRQSPLALVALGPATWSYQIVLALPEIFRPGSEIRQRSPGAFVAFAAAASCVHPPLITLATLAPIGPSALVLLSLVQSVGWLGLLALAGAPYLMRSSR